MDSVFTGDAMPQRIGLAFVMLVSSFLLLSFFSSAVLMLFFRLG